MSIDPNRPSPARVYDAFLGGTHNFAVDRSVASRIIEFVPEMGAIVRANRAFLHRVVRYAVARGVRQFIDLGSGIPTEGNVHEIALAADPRARVAYVDIDTAAVLYGRELLNQDDRARWPRGRDDRAVVVQGDLRDPESVLADPELRSVIDLSRPTGILMFSVLHFLPDGPVLDAALRGYREAVVPGSLLALSHASGGRRPEAVDRVADMYSRTGTPFVPRDEEQFTAFFEGWDLVEPGVVRGPRWRPDASDEPLDDPAASLILAGVGRR